MSHFVESCEVQSWVSLSLELAAAYLAQFAGPLGLYVAIAALPCSLPWSLHRRPGAFATSFVAGLLGGFAAFVCLLFAACGNPRVDTGLALAAMFALPVAAFAGSLCASSAQLSWRMVTRSRHSSSSP